MTVAPERSEEDEMGRKILVTEAQAIKAMRHRTQAEAAESLGVSISTHRNALRRYHLEWARSPGEPPRRSREEAENLARFRTLEEAGASIGRTRERARQIIAGHGIERKKGTVQGWRPREEEEWLDELLQASEAARLFGVSGQTIRKRRKGQVRLRKFRSRCAGRLALAMRRDDLSRGGAFDWETIAAVTGYASPLTPAVMAERVREDEP